MLESTRRRKLRHYRKKKVITRSLVREIFSWIFYTAVAIFIAVVLVMAFGMRVRVIGESMEPTLYQGQSVLINRVSYRAMAPKAGDVIAFLPNGNTNSHYYLKRVVGVPGDRIQIKDGLLYINGEEQETTDTIYDRMEDAGIVSSEITVGSGEYFVLGDNRNSSEDSRSANIGLVSSAQIEGRVWYAFGGDEGETGLVKSQ